MKKREFPIIAKLGGEEAVIKAMKDDEFSRNPQRLLRSFLDRRQISSDGMTYLMEMADDVGVPYSATDFCYVAHPGTR